MLVQAISKDLLLIVRPDAFRKELFLFFRTHSSVETELNEEDDVDHVTFWFSTDWDTKDRNAKQVDLFQLSDGELGRFDVDGFSFIFSVRALRKTPRQGTWLFELKCSESEVWSFEVQLAGGLSLSQVRRSWVVIPEPIQCV